MSTVFEGSKVSPFRVKHIDPDGTHRWGAAEVRNDVPWKPYQRRSPAAEAAIVERVCRWRRSLIAAAMVLELAAEEDQ